MQCNKTTMIEVKMIYIIRNSEKQINPNEITGWEFQCRAYYHMVRDSNQ